MSLIIKYASIDDLHNLGLIHSKSLQEAFKGIIDDSILNNDFSISKRKEDFKKELTIKEPNNIIMYKNDIPIGLLSWGESRYEQLDESSIEIWRIYIAPEFWGLGYGKKLMEWGLNDISKNGYKKVILWVLKANQKARNFYSKMRFLEVGNRFINVGKELEEVKYYKNL